MKATSVNQLLLLLTSGILSANASVDAAYLSLLDPSPEGQVPLAAGGWAALFVSTGLDRPGYYRLDSVSLSIAGVVGMPSDLHVSIFDTQGILPGRELTQLTSLSPVDAGIRTFTPTTQINLLPQSGYFVVLHALGNPETDGYLFNAPKKDAFGRDRYTTSAGWWSTSALRAEADDGKNWYRGGETIQFAIDATLVPEPSSLALCVLGALLLLAARARHIGRRCPMKSIPLVLALVWGMSFGNTVTTRAQGLTYWSSIVPSVTQDPVSVGSDAWIAYRFNTGTAQYGFYRLDSIRVRLAPGSDPDALRVAIYSQNKLTHLPGAELGALSGPTSHEGDVTTYSAERLSLQPVTRYYVVFAATEPLVAHPANILTTAAVAGNFDARDGWFLYESAGSRDGLNWSRGAFGIPQLAIDATLVPEPSSLALLGLGGVLLLGHRRQGKALPRPAANPRLG